MLIPWGAESWRGQACPWMAQHLGQRGELVPERILVDRGWTESLTQAGVGVLHLNPLPNHICTRLCDVDISSDLQMRSRSLELVI